MPHLKNRKNQILSIRSNNNQIFKIFLKIDKFN